MSGTSTAGSSPLEERLIEAVARGELLDLAGDQPVDATAMGSWGPSRTIRAWLVRDIVRGRLVADPDPRGLRLRGARVAGLVDLENVAGDLDVWLQDCFLPDGLLLRGAGLRGLGLTGCRIEQPAGSTDEAIDAERFTVRVMSLEGAIVTASTSRGALRLSAAHIGHLNCAGARLENASGPALHADGLRVDGSMFLTDGFTATGTSDLGAVRLLGAHIGRMESAGARLDNASGPALHADGMQVDQDMFLTDGFTATGNSGEGAVRLLGAHIGGELDCTGARLDNASGPALVADGLQVDQAVVLTGGFTATGNSGEGAVRLLDAHIGRVDCDGRLDNSTGPALFADNLRVDRGMFLRDGFTATGAGDLAAVSLHGAHIGGQLACGGATLDNASGPALVADNVQVDQAMFLSGGFAATGGGERAVVSLRGVRVGGRLWLDTDQITRSRRDGGALVDLDGATYAGLPLPASLERWLRLFNEHTPAYAAQPYQQLAAAHRAAGHDREVRTILMAQRRDQIDRRAIIGWDRTWARLTGLTLGFGYQPWRALLLLLAVLALSVTLAVTAGQRGGLAHTNRSTTPNASCSTLEQVGVGLDLGTPLLKTGARDLCGPTASTAGQALTVAGWLLQILAWALAVLFIAGFTGAVRKT